MPIRQLAQIWSNATKKFASKIKERIFLKEKVGTFFLLQEKALGGVTCISTESAPRPFQSIGCKVRLCVVCLCVCHTHNSETEWNEDFWLNREFLNVFN